MDRIDDPRTGRPIGSGPFLVQEWKRGERLTLVRNPRYWGRRAFLDRIDIRFTLDPSGVVELFRQGADVALYQFSGDLVAALSRVPDVRRSSSPTAPGWEHLPSALAAEVTRRSRTSASGGRSRSASIAWPSSGTCSARPDGNCGRWTASSSAAMLRRPNWGIYRYRPQEAVRQLQLAGCRRAATASSCAGEPLSFELVSRNVIARRVRTLERVQDQLRRVGIEVRPTYATPAGHDGLLETGEFDVTLFAWFDEARPGAGDQGAIRLWGQHEPDRLLPTARNARADQADRILDAAARGNCSIEPTHSWRTTCR